MMHNQGATFCLAYGEWTTNVGFYGYYSFILLSHIQSLHSILPLSTVIRSHSLIFSSFPDSLLLHLFLSVLVVANSTTILQVLSYFYCHPFNQ